MSLDQESVDARFGLHHERISLSASPIIDRGIACNAAPHFRIELVGALLPLLARVDLLLALVHALSQVFEELLKHQVVRIRTRDRLYLLLYARNLLLYLCVGALDLTQFGSDLVLQALRLFLDVVH